MKAPTPSETLAEVRKLQEEFPLAHYSADPGRTCEYHTGVPTDGPPTPGCLIGQAWRRLGVLDATLADLSDLGGVRSVYRVLYPRDSFGADLEALEDIQENQDSFVVWGACG